MSTAILPARLTKILLITIVTSSPVLRAEQSGPTGSEHDPNAALTMEKAFLVEDESAISAGQADQALPIADKLEFGTDLSAEPVLPVEDDPEAAEALAREQAFLVDDDPTHTPALTRERAFLDAIANIESDQGAYAPELPEHMLSLGLDLQRQQRHAEAVDIFKRGVHLARINNGLYCPEQIPLLRGEIDSHVAMGEYGKADERQHYLYRVQLRSLGGGEERANALIQQADYQYRAYRLGMGWQGFGRLTNMWDLYRLALTDIMQQDGGGSADLLPPLYGMLRAQYLIAGYDGDNEESSGLSFSSNYTSQQEANRFYSFRAQSYKRGQSVILAIHDVQKTLHGEDSLEAASAMVMLGDWAQWHEKRDEASKVYADAIAELGALDDAQLIRERLFAEPVALPDLEGIRPLPPEVSADKADVMLEFGVDPRGKVIDLVRLDDDDESKTNAYRLMRELRKTRFRPRFEAGQPVGTEKLVRAYDIEQ